MNYNSFIYRNDFQELLLWRTRSEGISGIQGHTDSGWQNCGFEDFYFSNLLFYVSFLWFRVHPFTMTITYFNMFSDCFPLWLNMVLYFYFDCYYFFIDWWITLLVRFSKALNIKNRTSHSLFSWFLWRLLFSWNPKTKENKLKDKGEHYEN